MRKTATACALLLLLATALNPAQAQHDLVYVAVAPCRVADTRESGAGLITANTVREFKVAGAAGDLASQGGAVDCLNPRAEDGQKPIAVAAYILAVPAESSSGGGVLSAYPADQDPPPVGSGSTVNFRAAPIGNTSIVTVCSAESCPAGGELAVISRNSDEHVVIDVQGYFYPAASGGVSGVTASTVPLEAGQLTQVAALNLIIPSDGTLILSYSGVAEFADGVSTVQCSGSDLSSGLATTVSADSNTVEFLPLAAIGVLQVEAGNFSFSVSCQSDVATNVLANALTATLAGHNLGAF